MVIIEAKEMEEGQVSTKNLVNGEQKTMDGKRFIRMHGGVV